MKLLNNFKAWKSTLAGLLLIGAGIAYLLLKEDIELMIFGITIASGITLLLSPDTLLDGIRAFINKNQNKEI